VLSASTFCGGIVIDVILIYGTMWTTYHHTAG
jgi:hypothetical protein